MTSTNTTAPAPAYGIDVQATAGEVRLDVAGELVPLYLDEAHDLVDRLQAAIRNARIQQAAMDRQRQAEDQAREWAEQVHQAWSSGHREHAANLRESGVFVLVEVDDEGTSWSAVAFDGDHFRYEYPAAPDLRRLQSWLANILRGSRPR